VCPYPAILLIEFEICSIANFSCPWPPLGFQCYLNNLHHGSQNFLWQRATPVIVGWFGGCTWKNYSKGIPKCLNCHVIFVVYTQFQNVAADCMRSMGCSLATHDQYRYAHTFFKLSFMSRKYLRPRCDNIRRAMRHMMEAPEDQRVSSIGHSTTWCVVRASIWHATLQNATLLHRLHGTAASNLTSHRTSDNTSKNNDITTVICK
jgi:hypothetical protein